MKKVLLYIWQLPQNLAGLFLRLILKGEHKRRINGITIYLQESFPGGISLGTTIILDCEHEFCAKHEYGHQIQSKYLGPLYLIIVGLPSLIWAALYGPIIKPAPNKYYKFYTEKWADKLGGVSR